MRKAIELFESLYRRELKVLEYASSPLLLAIRLYWGWQFYVAGSAHLRNLDKTADFFASLGIPAPKLNVYMAGGTEAVCGLLLLAGIASRIVTIPLMVTMIVAYATAERESVANIWSNPDGFVSATPFLFLYASVIVLVFGPGSYSVDHVVGTLWKRFKKPDTSSKHSGLD